MGPETIAIMSAISGVLGAAGAAKSLLSSPKKPDIPALPAPADVGTESTAKKTGTDAADAMRKRLAGLSGTIKTSPLGALVSQGGRGSKTLLGE